MSPRVPAKQDKSATKPCQKMRGHTGGVNGIIGLPDKRIITYSSDGSLRVWDLESGTQVGDVWEDEGSGSLVGIALSPDGKTVANGSYEGIVRLWNVDTGKVIKKWTGHRDGVNYVCWSPDGGRVVSGSGDGIFRVWDVESRKIILGPIEAGDLVWVVCYSPDGTMIATGGRPVKVWDANTGGLLRTLEESAFCLAWTSDGKTLFTAGPGHIRRVDTATWTETTILEGHHNIVGNISLSPNDRILASTSYNK